ncbi:MAG: D-alanine--D-alanine ligase [Gemmatimonadota bacterium]|nr:D-alanine--D-alanine ligase [Gemmatimonadota bacterium]
MSALRVAVLLGGTSEERRVSLASGRAVVAALREAGHEVRAVDPAFGAILPEEEDRYLGGPVGTEPPGLDELRRMGATAVGAAVAELPAVRDADVVFVALHGGDGENGRLQALLDVAGIPYTGSGPLGSAIAFDKRVSKELLAAAGIPTPPWAPRDADPGRLLADPGLPLVVKPANGGSSVGLTVVKEEAALAPALALAGRYDADVLCERYVPGRELTVTVLDDRSLPVVEIFPGHEVYDYESKYTPGGSRYQAPADLAPAAAERIAALAERAFHALRQRAFSRIDFRMDADDGSLWCLEANAVPGMTATSLVPKAAAAAGIPFPALCDRIARAGAGRGGRRRTSTRPAAAEG